MPGSDRPGRPGVATGGLGTVVAELVGAAAGGSHSRDTVSPPPVTAAGTRRRESQAGAGEFRPAAASDYCTVASQADVSPDSKPSAKNPRRKRCPKIPPESPSWKSLLHTTTKRPEALAATAALDWSPVV